MRRVLLSACLCFLLIVPVISFAQDPSIEIDIKPGSCPNPFNAKSNGTIPVAIVGTDALDVTQVDPATVLLAGVSPIKWDIQGDDPWEGDPTAPPDNDEPEECEDCFDDEGAEFNCDLWDAGTAETPIDPPVPGTDGILDSYCADEKADLILHFDSQELAEAIDAIGEPDRDDCVQLVLIGARLDGTPIIGMDSVVIRTKTKNAPSSTALTTCWGNLKTE